MILVEKVLTISLYFPQTTFVYDFTSKMMMVKRYGVVRAMYSMFIISMGLL